MIGSREKTKIKALSEQAAESDKEHKKCSKTAKQILKDRKRMIWTKITKKSQTGNFNKKWKKEKEIIKDIWYQYVKKKVANLSVSLKWTLNKHTL